MLPHADITPACNSTDPALKTIVTVHSPSTQMADKTAQQEEETCTA